jgi:hypothetical protein
MRGDFEVKQSHKIEMVLDDDDDDEEEEEEKE